MSGRSDTIARWMISSNCRTILLRASRRSSAPKSPWPRSNGRGANVGTISTHGIAICGLLAAYHRMTKQDMDAAIADLESAIGIDPEFANAHALLGQCHVHIGMRGWIRPARPAFEEARRWADEAVRLAPTSPEANQSLAFVLAMTGEAEQAIRVAQRAIELNPNMPRPTLSWVMPTILWRTGSWYGCLP